MWSLNDIRFVCQNKLLLLSVPIFCIRYNNLLQPHSQKGTQSARAMNLLLEILHFHDLQICRIYIGTICSFKY